LTEETIVETPSGPVAFREEGEGPPVLFVDGSPGGSGTHLCVWTDPASEGIQARIVDHLRAHPA